MSIFDFFGFSIKKKEDKESRLLTVVPPTNDDAALIIRGPGSSFQTLSYNLNFDPANEEQLINKYRELALNADIDSAIDEIVNEMVYSGDQTSLVSINLDKLDFSDDIKKIIEKEFEYILSILDFNENAYDIIKQWYIDGKIYYNIVIDPENLREGIIDLRNIDPRRIRKVREVVEEKNRKGVAIPTKFEDYYIYEDATGKALFKIPADSIAMSHSGLIEDRNGKVRILSFLHAAIKPFNQLRMLEDSVVIYRLARAPERRVFKIDTGNMPPHKAEQYVYSFAQKHKKTFSYDSVTGDLRDETRNLAMLEDYFFPVREGGRGTDVTTLPGGTNLGEIEDIKYMQKKLYRALRVPVSRLDETSTFNTGRSSEILREELKFSKFIQRLRVRFSTLFTDLLKKQLILKNIISLEDWDEYIKNNIFYDFKHDSYFTEYNDAEIMSRRMELASQAEGLKDYFSKAYIQKKFLKLTDEEIERIKLDNLSKDEGFESEDGSDEMDSSFEPEFTPPSMRDLNRPSTPSLGGSKPEETGTAPEAGGGETEAGQAGSTETPQTQAGPETPPTA